MHKKRIPSFSKKTNTFTFHFEHEIDVRMVLENRPWSTQNQHLMLKEWQPDEAFEEISFDRLPF